MARWERFCLQTWGCNRRGMGRGGDKGGGCTHLVSLEIRLKTTCQVPASKRRGFRVAVPGLLGAVLGAVFFQLPFCRKKINLSLLDQNDFLPLSWAAGTVCAGLTPRAPPARSPPPQNLPGACVGRGTKRTENPPGSGFAVQGGINPGTAAARSLLTGWGIFQQETAAICTGRDAPRCSVSMGRGQG